jgi:CDGSH-type Zn-finger protein
MSDADDETGAADATTIRIARNGPLTVRGPVRLEGADGAAWTDIPEGTNVALCRCGLSAVKPFCDGSHNAGGFESSATAEGQPYPW